MAEQFSFKNGLSEKALELPLFSTASQILTPSDFRIANFIAENLEDFMEMTISDLSRSIQVSEITISRFCKKLDLPGLQALKINLSKELNASNPFISADLNIQDSCKEITEKIFANIQEGLKNTLSLLDFAALENAALLLANTPRILLFGFGNSATVCNDIATRFVRLEKSCEVSCDPHQQVTLASICKENTTVVAVSYSGASTELVNSLKIAQRQNLKIILITSHKNSPAAKLADVVLIGIGPEVKHNSESSVSRLIHLAIGDVLYTRISFLQNHRFEENMQKMREAISTLKS